MRYFIHPFNKYLRACYVLGSVLDARDTVENKKDEVLSSCIFSFNEGWRKKNQWYEEKNIVKGIEKEAAILECSLMACFKIPE